MAVATIERGPRSLETKVAAGGFAVCSKQDTIPGHLGSPLAVLRGGRTANVLKLTRTIKSVGSGDSQAILRRLNTGTLATSTASAKTIAPARVPPIRSSGRGAIAMPRFAIVEAINRSATYESTTQ